MPKVKIAPNTSMPQVAAKMQDPAFRAAYLQHVLKEVELELPGHVSSWIAKTQPFNSRTGWAVSKWTAKQEGSGSIRLTSLVPYVYWLNYGVRPHQMVYLLNTPIRQYYAFGHAYFARAPIPIVKGWTKAHGKGVASQTIFRRATEKAMAQGKWRHPGYQGRHFLEAALTYYVQVFMERHPELIVDFQMG